MLIIPIIILVIAIGAYIAIKLTQLTFQKLILIILGLVFGSLIGALIGIPLGKLPSPYDTVVPVTVTIVAGISLAIVFYMQHKTLAHLFPKLQKPITKPAPPLPTIVKEKKQILVDTSAIIDGRIADIAATGFVPGKLIVPRFILAELQNIADSEDPMRRSRGRRGLEMLNMLRENDAVELDIVDEDPKDVREVDHKLVHLARKYKTDILTTDYNLNRVATIESVKVLNINELANAIRAVVLPGEEMQVHVVQPGKERHQGVAYLPDGTMIVIENGDKLIGRDVNVEVTRIFQTIAGKMIFAAERSSAKNGNSNHVASKSAHKTPLKPHSTKR